jgi:hypothetical protein
MHSVRKGGVEGAAGGWEGGAAAAGRDWWRRWRGGGRLRKKNTRTMESRLGKKNRRTQVAVFFRAAVDKSPEFGEQGREHLASRMASE